MREFPESFKWFKPTKWILYTPREAPREKEVAVDE